MRAQFKLAAMTGSALLAASSMASAQPAPASTKPASQCFYSHDWDGWKATDDSKAIYIRVGVNRYYRIDFSTACPTLNFPNVHLVTKSVNDLVCSAIDLDIKVADGQGFATPCIVSSITPLSTADVQALPKKLKP